MHIYGLSQMEEPAKAVHDSLHTDLSISPRNSSFNALPMTDLDLF